MKQLAGAIRIGWVIEYKGKPWTLPKLYTLNRVKAVLLCRWK